ncbi:MAG: hypothetical protein IJT51_09670 [Bacteroidales bacterium]|nr:hypothetical protein [Bacteroidales bacterium]
MNKHILIFIAFFFPAFAIFSQNTITLTFTGIHTDATWQKLDSVTVENSSKGWSETLVYDDTVLILHTENGINETAEATKNAGCYPNPFAENSTAEIFLKGGATEAALYTLTGERVAVWTGSLASGFHTFSVSAAAAQPYFLSIRSANDNHIFKIICTSPALYDKIEIIESKTFITKATKGDCQLPFSKGDNMIYTGYCVQGTIPQNVSIEQAQYDDEIIPFVFQKLASQVCPENATLTDTDGNIYNTVLIGKQCWMRENLKVTRYADGTGLPLGNDTVHDHSIPFYFKYANSDSLAKIYGMLYSWTAAMRNLGDTTLAQVQGICPNGWHLPSDEEWCEMTSTLAPLSSCYDATPFFGGDEYLARSLSLPGYWVSDNFTFDGMPGYWSTSPLYFNTSGFSALPTGFYEHGSFFGLGAGTYWWTTKPAPNGEAYCRYLQYNNKGMNRNTEEICHGLSIRCVMN